MLQCGFGAGDITPEIGMNIPGGFLPNPGKGVRDRLLASAFVVTDGTRSAALVGIDALFVGKGTVDACRRIIQKETKIPGANVLIGANHTHSGGPIESCFSGASDEKYIDKAIAGITSAVKDAWGSLHASEIGVGAGTEEGLAFNRRFLMRDGREITHPGKPGTPHHDQIVCPAGPADPGVGVLAVRAPRSDRIRGVVVHFGCHSTLVGGNLFSPDYAGYLRQHLKAIYGASTPVCFLLGPCGDITQVDNMATSRDGGPELADLFGRKLASEAARVIRRMKWLDDAKVDVAAVEVPCAIRELPEVAKETPAFGLGSDGKDRVIGKIFDAERRLVEAERKKTPVIACEVQAVRIGPLGVVTNGAEFFCELGLRIKKASRMPFTWVSTLTNEYIGYVPTADAFAAGGYEPRTARSSKLAADSGQRLVEGALKALAKVTG